MVEWKLLFFLSFLTSGCMAQFLSKTSMYPAGTSLGLFNSHSTSIFPGPSMSANSTLIEYTPTVVKENKTWEDALHYCRTYYTHLACPTLDTQLLLDENEAAQSQTIRVWMGLHFLDGKWIWVNGEVAGSQVSLPSCPAKGYRCGARNHSSNLWEDTDCHQKLNFICY